MQKDARNYQSKTIKYEWLNIEARKGTSLYRPRMTITSFVEQFDLQCWAVKPYETEDHS